MFAGRETTALAGVVCQIIHAAGRSEGLRGKFWRSVRREVRHCDGRQRNEVQVGLRSGGGIDSTDYGIGEKTRIEVEVGINHGGTESLMASIISPSAPAPAMRGNY